MLLLYNIRYKLWYIVIANLDHRMYVLCIDSILLNIILCMRNYVISGDSLVDWAAREEGKNKLPQTAASNSSSAGIEYVFK